LPPLWQQAVNVPELKTATKKNAVDIDVGGVFSTFARNQPLSNFRMFDRN
jgi:hypothetical protein